MGQLDGKIAIITGGGGYIGRGIARAFIKEGAKVAVPDRYPEASQAAAEEVRQLGGEAISMTCNVADVEQVKKMVEQVVQTFGPIDILVNNAQSWTGGTKSHQGALIEDLPEEWWDESFSTGIMATWHCSKAVFPYMKDRGGKIINFGSIMGIVGWEKTVDYNANKEAIRSFTRTAAREWGKYKINVNTICPSAMTIDKVPFQEGAKEEAEQYIKERAAQLPMGRVGDPEKDMGRVAVFLSSADSDYVTGQTFMVDGGAYML